MSDLPEILSGAIALEYKGTIQGGWLAYDDKPQPPSKTVGHCVTCTLPECQGSDLPKDCTVEGPSCPVGDCSSRDLADCCNQKQASFYPTVAGWSTPPALDVR